MPSVIQNALEKASKTTLKIETISEPKPKKSQKNIPIPCCGMYKPSLYLDDKQLGSISQYKAGDKVVLVIECSVRACTVNDRIIDGKAQKRHDAEIEIDSFADITPPSKGGK